MKLYLYFFLFISYFVTSCGNKPTEQQKDIPADTPADVPSKAQNEKSPPPSDC